MLQAFAELLSQGDPPQANGTEPWADQGSPEQAPPQHPMRVLGMLGTPATDGASKPTAFENVKSVNPPSVPITGGTALHLHHQQPGAFEEHQILLAPAAAPVPLGTGCQCLTLDSQRPSSGSVGHVLSRLNAIVIGFLVCIGGLHF